ncbi:S8 family serine peptidase [Streptomyces caniferus]|uniref:S8 family serine peptidase n=1 Tax=Streptomyces caniferus TaxID=285557 RepID=UPI0033C4635B
MKGNVLLGKSFIDGGNQLMLSAPGVEITSASATAGQYRLADGTSDATAYVSATAALLCSKFPELSAALGKAGLALPEPHSGYGFIHLLKALTADIPAGSKNGPLKTLRAEPAPTAGDDQASEQTGSGLGTGAMVGIGPVLGWDVSATCGSPGPIGNAA